MIFVTCSCSKLVQLTAFAVDCVKSSSKAALQVDLYLIALFLTLICDKIKTLTINYTLSQLAQSKSVQRQNYNKAITSLCGYAVLAAETDMTVKYRAVIVTQLLTTFIALISTEEIKLFGSLVQLSLLPLLFYCLLIYKSSTK